MQARLFLDGAVFQAAILLMILSLSSPIEAGVSHVDIESRSDVLEWQDVRNSGSL